MKNKDRYRATPVVCEWAGAVIEKVTWAFGHGNPGCWDTKVVGTLS